MQGRATTQAGKPARLVLVLQDLLFGGSQRHALELVKGIDRARFAPELWMLARGADFEDQARRAGVVRVWLSERPTVTPAAVVNLWRKLKACPPDILMPLTAVPNIWARLLGRLAGAPVVVGTCRGGGAVARQHEKHLGRLAHHHVANTQALKDALVALGRTDAQVSVIRNGVDTSRFTPPPPELRPVRKVVLCVARLVEDKDHLTLLRAFESVAKTDSEAELWLVGDGPLKPRIELFIRRLACKSRVRLYPGGADLSPFYQQASVLALSSVREGLPNVILEGMASGLPVAATAVGGVPEVVEHGVTGLLSPAGDHAALARGLGALLADEGLRMGMGLAARRVAEADYSMPAMVGRHEELFERLLAGRGSPGLS